MSSGQSNGSGLYRKSVNCQLIKNVRPNNRFAIQDSDWPFGYKPIGQSIKGFMEQNNINAIPGMYWFKFEFEGIRMMWYTGKAISNTFGLSGMEECGIRVVEGVVLFLLYSNSYLRPIKICCRRVEHGNAYLYGCQINRKGHFRPSWGALIRPKNIRS